jgi:putative DNA primase/helicase
VNVVLTADMPAAGGMAGAAATLTPADLAAHRALGIDVDLLERLQVHRVDDAEARRLLACINRPGDMAGIAYPYFLPWLGRTATYRVRRDRPEVEKGRPKHKYLSPVGGRPHLYFAVTDTDALADTTIPLVVVEAEKSVLAITSAARRVGRSLLVVGLGGCWGWRGRIGKVETADGGRADELGPLPDWDHLAYEGRDAVAMLDANAARNVHVQAARHALACLLADRRAHVRIAELPQEAGVNGPDDYLGLHGDAALLALLDAAAAVGDRFPLTEAGDAEYFAQLATGRYVFDHTRRRWYVFGPHHWRLDTTNEVTQAAIVAMRERQAHAFRRNDETDRKRAIRWTLGGESEARLRHLLDLASSYPAMRVVGTDWDREDFLLGVLNGVVELRTGTLRPGTPSDRITRVAAVPFEPNAPCPRWERFILEVSGDDPDLAAFHQRFLGYALTGATSEQCFRIDFGLGSNGKSTLLEVITRHVIPDHSWTMSFPTAAWTETIGEYQRAELVGRRLVVAKESEESKRLNTEFIKSLTGGDTVNARHPYGRPFQFVPAAKFILACNHRPVIRDDSHGMWRRVRLVPFNRTFALDPNFINELCAEASGILAWMVRGCLEWQAQGLGMPAAVTQATAEYRQESDTLALFIAACCLEGDGCRVRAQAFMEGYDHWCQAQRIAEHDRLSGRAIGSRMKQRYRALEGRHVTYVGIGLRQDEGQG